jgi:hypothetical protein
MAEMVEDGRTGWIADGPDARSLETALRRAVATPPLTLAQMGAAAGESIRATCDNRDIVSRQLELRRRIVSVGCRRAVKVPLPIAPGPLVLDHDRARARRATINVAQGTTMTALDILRASPRQQLAVLRRAVTSPGYVARWVAWQGRSAINRASQKGRA